jgi:polyhydroxyalkanoate synthase
LSPRFGLPIAPAKSVYLGSRYFGGPVRFVLTGSGHIAGVINPPSRGKYQYWTGNAPDHGELDEWLAKAEEHPGSWWTDWFTWLRGHDEEQVPARDPAKGPLTPIEDAPGSYVKVRS